MSALEEEARKRKERLAAMKRKAEGLPDEEGDGDTGMDADEQPSKPKFRSYQPIDERTKETGEEVGRAEPGELGEVIQEQLAGTKDLTRVDNIDLNLLAPRKIDWDLKRDVEKKLDKLERKTQRVIAELIRERIATGKTSDLLSEVRVQTRDSEVQRQADLSDEEDED